MLWRKLIRTILVLCCAATVLQVRAAAPPALSYLGIEQGLSNNSVTCIYQDHNGFMWFGTYNGLNRYDGYACKVFRKQPGDSASLNFNQITAIGEDARYTLWIGTTDGVSTYNPITAKFAMAWYTPLGSAAPRKIVDHINEIKTDRKGNVFIASGTGLLICKKDQRTALEIPFENRNHYDVTAIEFDNHQHAWLYVLNEGLCEYDYATNSIKVVNAGLPYANCLKADSNGNMFAGANDGLYELAAGASSFAKIFPTADRIAHLTIVANGDLWIASDGGGIFILHSATRKITSFEGASRQSTVTSSAVFDIYQDKDLRIWIGTLRGGVDIIDPNKNPFTTVSHDPQNSNSLINNFVSCFTEDTDQDLWIGTDGGGLSCWNRAKNRFANYRHNSADAHSLSSDLVTGLVTDNNSDIWISTWYGGVDRFNRHTGTFKQFNCFNPVTGSVESNVWRLYEDQQQTLWAVTFGPGSLYRFNREKQVFELFDGSLTGLTTLGSDRRGQLWAGDHNSLILIDKVQKRHRRYFIGNVIRAIHEDRVGRFWIGTEDGGLLLFNPQDGKFVRFAEKDGLCSNAVLNILEDAWGNLWLSTFNGLSKFDPENKKFTTYSQSDNLQSNQFSYNAALVLHTGELAFGGIKGFTFFDPKDINASRTVPPVFIAISGQATEQVKQIRLPYNKATLSFDFVALEYTSPDKINYAYQLVGRDEGWVYAGRTRTVNYTSLHEGSYIFKVKATDTDGDWTGKEQQLSIVVLPPWYRSWWAWLLYVTAAASLAYVYLRYQAQKSRLAMEVAWAKKETEHEKELNEKKLSFFTNISHEFRSPLTLIIEPLKEFLRHPEKPAGTADLGIVYRNARRLLSLVDQLLLFRKADAETDKVKVAKLNFSALCHEVFACFTQQAKAKNIEYIFHAGNPDIELFADREKMEIVLFNLISNALKFTPDGGSVTVALQEHTASVQLTVRDSGCGIEANVGDRLFERFYQEKNTRNASQSGFGIGLFLVKQFVDAHKGTISYRSEPNRGTQFTLVLKKGIGHWNGQDIREEIAENPEFLHELIDYEEPAPLPAAKADPQEMFTEKKSVLLVDYNAEIRSHLTQIFKDQFIIYEAEDGEAGWRLALDHVPDVVISDVVMGGMTGVELCRKIKQEPSLMHVPVILLTASSSSDIKLKGIECGADDYFTKPFEKELLAARVDTILRNRNTLQQYFFERITLQKNYTRIPALYKEFLERCIAVVEDNLDNEQFNVKVLVKEMNMSHSSLYKKVKAISGQSINAFIRLIRLRKAAVILLSTDTNITEAAFSVGLADVKYFRRQFVKLFGMPPSEYIKKYKGSFSKELKHITLVFLLLFLSAAFTLVRAQTRTIPLYSDTIPNSKPAPDEEQSQINNDGVKVISKISRPTLTIFSAAQASQHGAAAPTRAATPTRGATPTHGAAPIRAVRRTGAAVIICPGGGYWVEAIDLEGTEVARKFAAAGVTAIVLKYRLPSDQTMRDRSIGALQDAQEAIKVVREHAREWGLDPHRIGIMGFSAGGHLAAMTATHFAKALIPDPEATSLRPDFLILGYPVVTCADSLRHAGSCAQLIGPNPTPQKAQEFSAQLRVTDDTPPSFIVLASDDTGVSPQNSLLFFQALLRHHVPAELHSYEHGGHGFGLHLKDTSEDWMGRCIHWMQANGWLQ